MTYAKTFWGYRFQQEVLGRKLPETQKDIIVIFENFFFQFKICIVVMGRDYLLRKNKLLSNYQLDVVTE